MSTIGKISRKKDNGFTVKQAFEDTLKLIEKEKYRQWRQNESELKLTTEDELEEESFWSKLTSCFQSPLKCNPGVQIDFRGKGVKENPLRTSFIMSPKTTTIIFNNIINDTKTGKPAGFIEFEFKTESEKSNVIDVKTQYLIIQVLDNEVESERSDRVIAESLLTFSGFIMGTKNWCSIPIYECVEEEKCGEIILSAQFIENKELRINKQQQQKDGDGDGDDDEVYDGNKLQIYVEQIINLSDPNAELVKEDSTVKRDVIILISWLIYMILSILFYIYGEDFIFIDALYLRIVTAFTVGYGDMYPVTNAGKLLNCLFIIVDTVTIGFITSKVMNYILRFREIQKEKKENAKRKANQEAKRKQEEAARKQKEEKKKKEKKEKEEEEENNDNKEEEEEHKDDAKMVSEDEEEEVAGAGHVISEGAKKMADAIQENTKETRDHASQFWGKNKLYILGGIILIFIIVGTLFMVYVEGHDGPSAFEWNFVTLSTVGYGDVTPQTVGGKVFTIFYIIFGVSLVVYFGTAIFEKLDENRQRKFKQQVMRRALISEAQLLEFDVDNDGKIDKYEFLSKMLVETQEVEQSKIEEIMKKFTMLDTDGNGEIETAELEALEHHGGN